MVEENTEQDKENAEQGDAKKLDQQELKRKLYDIIFGTESAAGKRFDLVLIYVILISVLALMLDSVDAISSNYGFQLRALEWFFTIIFTIEYGVRIYCSPKPFHYVRSFYGIIDLISILPSYLSLFITGVNFLLVIRLFRVLRVFRVLKLVRYLKEANVLIRALILTRRKIFVFFVFVLVLATIFGSLMYVVEGPSHGFTSIPISIYWTIVTITTVGYGDITPETVMGQMVASAAMLTGYSIIAVPTGIFTAELAQEIQRDRTLVQCPNCNASGHEEDAVHCKYCGSALK